MTLLTIAQDTADVIGLTRPNAVITGQDQLARQILGLARKTIDELGLMDWPQLQVPYTFDTVVDQDTYDLPSDWGREVGDTVYVGAVYDRIRGSLSPSEWAWQRSNMSSLGRYKFRVFGMPLKFHITPTPTTVEAVTLEYQTTFRVQQADTTYKSTWYADTDVPLVAEDLVKMGLEWRLRRAKGLDYSEEFDAYEFARNNRLAQQLQMGSMPVARRNMYDDDCYDYGRIPENGFG